MPKSFESRRMHLLAPVDQRDTVYVVVSMEDQAALPYLRQAYPNGRVVHEGKDREGGVYFSAYQVPAGTRPAVAPRHPLTATLGSAIALTGYDLAPDPASAPSKPGPFTVSLHWRALAPMDKDYTTFVHVVGQGGLLAQQDGQPGGSSYPTTRWDVGETIVDRFQLELGPGTPPGAYEIRVGMYLLASLQRLPALNEAGQRWADDAILVAKLRLE